MQIPADLRAAHKAYLVDCIANNVEPITSNFLLGDPAHWVRTFLQKASDDLLAAQYNMYVAACLAKDVEPVLKNFLVGDIPDSVLAVLEYVENEVGQDRKEKLAASA
jgi:hypothetical protein